MKVEIATLCDYAAIYENRLNILGTFNTISGPKLPITKPHCSIALKFTWAGSENGQHNFRLTFMNDDGEKTLEDMNSIIEVNISPHQFFSASCHVINLQQLKFNDTGTFQIQAYIDNELVAEIPISVALD